MVDNIAKHSVVDQPDYEQAPFGDFIFWLASIADDIQPWGGAYSNFKVRDLQLRDFWHKESVLASAIYNIAIRDASFSWTLTGDAPRTIKATQDMLHNANLGKGWLDFIVKWRVDFLTQDNGAFFEVIRQSDSPNSPVMGINHLDAGRCRRTGVPDWPVIYTDRKGRDHKLLPHQIVASADMPSPVETVNGMGLCAVSRVLRHAQFQRDISTRDRERSSGMDPNTIHMVSGISQKEIQTALASNKEYHQEQGYLRYNKPLIVSTIDPTKAVSVASIDLAPKPDWDYDTMMKWYITLLSMAIGVDYQDLAPLPARGIGGSQQSLILHQKSKGKGPEYFMKTIEHVFNFHGIIPKNITFEYDEKDIADEMEQAELLKMTGEAHKVFIECGTLTPQASRNILLDEGLMSQEIFDMLSEGNPDATEEVEAESDERMEEVKPSGQAPLSSEETKENLASFAEDERKNWEDAMMADMKRGLSKTFKDIKARLLPKKSIFNRGEKQSPEDLLGDEKFWDEFGLTMRESMAPNVRYIFLGVAEYNIELGLAVDMDLINTAVLDFSRTYIPEFITMVEDSTKKYVADAIVTWQEGGLGERGLPDLIDTLQLEFNEARAKRIAQTETTRIFDLGNKAAHEAAGIQYEQWQTANDSRVRPEHQEYQGKVFGVNEGPRPSDYINCRCARVPIAKDEAEKILARQ